MLEAACSPFIEPDAITCDCDNVSDAEKEELIDAASDVIAILTGGVITGICEETVIPRSTQQGGFCSCWNWGWGIGQSCQCSPLHGITLRGPNPEVTTITLNGAVFTDFAIVDDRLLVRTDGKMWPHCQSVTDPVLEIEYTYGRLPYLAQQAAEEIVCWLISNPPQAAQKLPQGTRGVSIAGVQITVETMINERKSGTLLLPFMSRLLTIYAPNGSQQSVAYSPELESGWTLHRVR